MEPPNRSSDAATNLRTNNTQATRTTTFFVQLRGRNQKMVWLVVERVNCIKAKVLEICCSKS